MTSSAPSLYNPTSPTHIGASQTSFTPSSMSIKRKASEMETSAENQVDATTNEPKFFRGCFKDEGADIALKSSDGYTFYVQSLYLMAAR